MKFLIVDDSATMRRIIIKALESFNYDQFLEAKNGADALSYIDEADFIITDWNMPIMDGYKFVQKIRTRYSNKPILMITTNADEDNVLKAIKGGVSGYIIKPFTPDTLIKKVDMVLKKSGIPQE